MSINTNTSKGSLFFAPKLREPLHRRFYHCALSSSYTDNRANEYTADAINIDSGGEFKNRARTMHREVKDHAQFFTIRHHYH